MVICKYFLRGNCRFGNACKNEHSYTDTTSILRKTNEIDTHVLVKTVIDDIDKAEKGNQWPFSCYGPFQGKPCFPGFEDKSFEEIRLGMYEAEKNGTVEQYKQQLLQYLQVMSFKKRALKNPTPDTAKIIRDLFDFTTKSPQTSNIFGNTSIFANTNTQFNQTPIFANTGNVNQQRTNIFVGQTPIISASNFTFQLPENNTLFHNVQTNSTNTVSMFNQNIPQQSFPNTNRMFVGGVPNQTNTSVFNNTPNFNQNIFRNTQSTALNSNPFMQNNIATNTSIQNTPIFNSPMAQQMTIGPTTNIFTPQVQEAPHQNSVLTSQQQTAQQNVLKSNTNDRTIYSKLEDLNDSDVGQYKADTFIFGKIPEKPPTLEMCSR